MRVAQLIAPHQFQLVDQPELPDPGPGEVQALVHSVGVCGSDLHNFAEGNIGDITCAYPQVLGHEPCGTVLQTGAGVSGWRKGDRVCLEPAIYCYHCEFCRSGHHNVCSNIRFMSMPQDPGYFRDRVNVPVHNVVALPPELSPQEGTLFEPLAVVLHSLKFAALQPGETVVVYGAGPIGLLTLQLLRLSGAGRIWAVEPVAARRELALKMGADAALDPAEAVKQVLRDTGGRGVDCAVDCAARGNSMNDSIALARNAGRVVVTGIPAEVRVGLDFHVMRRKELALLNVRRSNHETDTALEFLKQYRARFTPILTHEEPLERVQHAFETLEAYADGIGKVVIRL